MAVNYYYMNIKGSTNIVGLIGHPVEHSFSPPMHNAAFQSLGMDYAYVAFDVNPNDLSSAIEGARSLNIKGFNVTIPHKIEVMQYLNELDDNLPGFTSIVGSDVYTRNGSVEIDSLFGERLFSFPKPSDLIKPLIEQITSKDSLILDFFSGSATTAHAVMQMNAEDGGHRKFILVQLPEKCDENSEAAKAGYKTICEIGKERIRRAGDKILAEQQAKEKSAADKTDLKRQARSRKTVGHRLPRPENRRLQHEGRLLLRRRNLPARPRRANQQHQGRSHRHGPPLRLPRRLGRPALAPHQNRNHRKPPSL